jgi:hypothetical protein
MRPCLKKYLLQKRAGKAAQVTEHLPSKREFKAQDLQEKQKEMKRAGMQSSPSMCKALGLI